MDANISMPKIEYHYLKHHSTMILKINWIIQVTVNIIINYKEKEEVYARKYKLRIQNIFFLEWELTASLCPDR